jgi:hypothetical protein
VIAPCLGGSAGGRSFAFAPFSAVPSQPHAPQDVASAGFSAPQAGHDFPFVMVHTLIARVTPNVPSSKTRAR